MPLRLVAMVAALSFVLVSCGSDDSSSSGGGGGAAKEAGGTTPTDASCGMKSGKKATGTPIKVGAIVTKIPGIDFTDITDAAKAYFDCANDNGGINGHPVDYLVEEHGTDPQQVGSLATKLIESDKVAAFVGNTSILDCPVNHALYEKNNYYAIVAGVPNECFSTPNIAALNMGPLYSSLGAVRYVIDKAGAKGTLVIVSPKQPGNEAVNQGALSYAKQKGLKTVSRLENVPISDPASLAQAIVSQAGDGGGVVLDFTGPAVLPLLQAIEQQGLVDKVVWASSTPPNDPSVAKELSSAWNGKFLINAEFNTLDSGKPDQNHMNEIRQKYRSDIPSSSFAQMGYLAGRAATDALLGIKGDITKESVNAAFKAVKNFKSDLWCKPWYFDSTIGQNVSNNNDITVVPTDGNMVLKENCFAIAELPANPLKDIRAKEASLGLNAG